MKTIPPEILSRFDNILKMRKLPSPLHSDYRKWLRYFLDFQAKYPQPDERSVQIRLFSEKLQSKGQTASQVKQAADAVSIFFAFQQKAPITHSATRSGAVPDTTDKSTAGQPCTQVPAQSRTGKGAGMVCELPGPPVPAGHSWRRKGRFDDWRCLRTTAYPAWDAVIASLADEIKTRHYSRKTLQHYANWTRKYQSYLLHKDPANLSPQDVKGYLTYLAVDCKVSSSTQNLAFNALLFLYRYVLKKDFGDPRTSPAQRSPPMYRSCSHARRSRRFLLAWGSLISLLPSCSTAADCAALRR